MPDTTYMAHVIHQRMSELLPPEKMERLRVADVERLLSD
jgi:hypothetical protein